MEFLSNHAWGYQEEWHSCEGPDYYLPNGHIHQDFNPNDCNNKNGYQTTDSVSAGTVVAFLGGGTTTYFLNDGTDEIAEYDSTKTVTNRYIPGPAIDEPIAMANASTGAHEYFHTNRQGSVIAMSGDTGAKVEGPYVYDPHGNCFSGGSACNSAGEPYRFTGRRLDSETGLYYYRARYYWPQGGRFLQTDPIGYTADLNLYTYVGNDPTDMTDPDGEAAEQCTTDPGGTVHCTGDIETVVVTAQKPPKTDTSKADASRALLGRALVRPATSVSTKVVPRLIPFLARIGGVISTFSMLCGDTPAACDNQNSANNEPDENDLTKIPDRDANDVARQHGYRDAHEAKQGRGGGRVNIYRDKRTGQHYLWDGKKGSAKEPL